MAWLLGREARGSGCLDLWNILLSACLTGSLSVSQELDLLLTGLPETDWPLLLFNPND